MSRLDTAKHYADEPAAPIAYDQNLFASEIFSPQVLGPVRRVEDLALVRPQTRRVGDLRLAETSAAEREKLVSSRFLRAIGQGEHHVVCPSLFVPGCPGTVASVADPNAQPMLLDNLSVV
jgi:hypothetical protein